MGGDSCLLHCLVFISTQHSTITVQHIILFYCTPLRLGLNIIIRKAQTVSAAPRRNIFTLYDVCVCVCLVWFHPHMDEKLRKHLQTEMWGV